MRKKRFLAAILLGVVLCFVSGVGYGEIGEWRLITKVTKIDFQLLEAKVEYMGRNPETFLDIGFFYDPDGSIGGAKLPEKVSTKGKIITMVYDTRNRFSYKTGMILLDEFKRELEAIYSYIRRIATDLTNDIYGELFTAGGIPLAYFYQGEYHLWEE